MSGAGHEVEYFGMYDKNNVVHNSAEQYTQNMDFHDSGAEKFLYPFRIIYSFQARKKLRKVLENFQPDIVHMNNINYQLTPSIIDEISMELQSFKPYMIYKCFVLIILCLTYIKRPPVKNALTAQR